MHRPEGIAPARVTARQASPHAAAQAITQRQRRRRCCYWLAEPAAEHIWRERRGGGRCHRGAEPRAEPAHSARVKALSKRGAVRCRHRLCGRQCWLAKAAAKAAAKASRICRWIAEAAAEAAQLRPAAEAVAYLSGLHRWEGRRDGGWRYHLAEAASLAEATAEAGGLLEQILWVEPKAEARLSGVAAGAAAAGLAGMAGVAPTRWPAAWLARMASAWRGCLRIATPRARWDTRKNVEIEPESEALGRVA